MRGAPPLALPADRDRPATTTGLGGAERCDLTLTAAAGVRELSRRHGASLFTVLLAAYMVLLHRYTGEGDIVVGVPAADRRRAEFAGLIGCFLNTLALRADLSANPRFSDLLDQVQQVALDAFTHAEVPFERVVEALQPVRLPGHPPLFQVMFVLRAAAPPPVFPGMAVAVQQVTIERAEFDLTLDVTDEADGALTAALAYNAERFEPATIRRMAGHLRTLLAGIVADPTQRIGELPLLSEGERQQILVAWNPSQASLPPETACVHQMFEEQVARRPDALAVIAGGAGATYADLNRHANRIAQRLRDQGVRPETIVGLCVERSPEMVAGLLGILKAGGAYLPLDPTYPPERLALMLQDAGAAAVLTTRELSGRLPSCLARVILLDAVQDAVSEAVDANPQNMNTPGSLAYVIYTSGSTGRPKGVMVEHGSLACFTRQTSAAYGLGTSDRVLQFHALSFDASVEEIFPCLTSGATLVLRSEAMTTSAAAFWQEIRAREITVVSLPTSFWHRLALDGRDAAPQWPCRSSAEAVPALRLLTIGGDLAQSKTLRAWQAWLDPNVRIVIEYGPTEATVATTAYEVPRVAAGSDARGEPQDVPIGRPLPHARAYVLDEHLNPCPVGVIGELYLGGAGLARGYLGRPDLTAACFIADPFARERGARLYRTGDLARYLPDGNLVFVGRRDRQIKIRGYRIEPGEIEAALLQHPAVREAFVTVQPNATGEATLIAYVAPHVEGLRRWLDERLPPHMLPAAIVLLDTLPVTPGGKVDAAVLSPVDTGAPASMPPRTPAEELVSGVVADVLGLPEVSRDDSFFALGGHSLLAARVIARLCEAFGVDLPLAALFESPTVAGLASAAERARRESTPSARTPILLVDDEGETPLSPAQAPIWRAARALPGVPLFAIPTLLRLEGPLDIDHLQRSLTELTRRHRILSAVVAERGGAPALVPQPPSHFALPVVDLQDLPVSQHDAALQELVAAAQARPFDLRSEPPLRAVLARLGPEAHALCLILHHIAADGGTVAVLVEELAAIYEAFAAGRASPLPAPALQYADWVRWQEAWLQSPAAREQLAYWLKQLEGVLAPLDLPTARPRTTPRTYRYARAHRHLAAALTGELRRLASEHDVTLFMVLLAGIDALLHRYCGQSDLRVGAVVANRNRPETERLIGLLANTVILRINVSGGLTGRELLRQVRRTTLEAYAHQELPFEVLLEQLRSRHDLAHEAPFQVLLVFHNNPVRPAQAADLRIRPALEAAGAEKEPEFTVSTFDWIVEAEARPDGLALCLRYNVDLFEPEFIQGALGELEAYLERLTAHPNQPLSAEPLSAEAA